MPGENLLIVWTLSNSAPMIIILLFKLIDWLPIGRKKMLITWTWSVLVLIIRIPLCKFINWHSGFRILL